VGWLGVVHQVILRDDSGNLVPSLGQGAENAFDRADGLIVITPYLLLVLATNVVGLVILRVILPPA
jgi:hypothetical protein